MDLASHDRQENGVIPAPPQQSLAWDSLSSPERPSSVKPGAYTSSVELEQTWPNYDNSQAPPTVRDREKDALSRTTIAPPAPPFKPFKQTDLQATYLMRKTSRFGPSWAVACLALLTSAVTTYYSARVMVDERELPSALGLSPGRTVLVVNVLSKVVAFLCLALFTDVLEALRWTLACRPNGIGLTSFLAMSRATPIMGVLYLCKTRGMHQIWALQRALVFVMAFVVSIVLITDVTFKVVYTPYTPKPGDADASMRVVAGLAPVSTYGLGNISLTYVPMVATAYTIAFLTDPRFVVKVDPVSCTGAEQDCSSVLLPGGLEAVRWFNQTATNSSDQPALISANFKGGYTSIVIQDAPAFQFEFQSLETFNSSFKFDRQNDTQGTGDCQMHLQNQDDGLLFCQKEIGDHLMLGWSICPDDQFRRGVCQSELAWTKGTMWNTTVAMYSRRATVVYDRQNISILSVESITPPEQIKVPSIPFQVYTNIVMGAINETLNRTADRLGYELSASQFAFGFGAGYMLRIYSSLYNSYVDGGVYLLRSLIAVPYQFSTAIRHFGNPKQMPPENIVNALFSVSAYRSVVDVKTVWTFGILSLAMAIWCIVLLLWICVFGPYSPNISYFPEIDMTSKSTVHVSNRPGSPAMETADQTLEDLARLTRNFGLANGASSAVLAAIKDKRVYCGSLPGESESEDHIVLVTEAGRLKVLNKFDRYS